MWQELWENRGRRFLMLGIAQEARGPERVREIAAQYRIDFPVLVDRESVLARELGFGVVPSGFLVEDGAIRYSHTDEFDVGDPRVRRNVIRFLDGKPVISAATNEPASRAALELFASGVRFYEQGDPAAAVSIWRRALEIDPANFLVRSQIWVVEHPAHFYPVVDRAWQERQLMKEGYDQPLP